MKGFVSDNGLIYATKDECLKADKLYAAEVAEKEAAAKKAEEEKLAKETKRKERAKEIEDAMKACYDAQEKVKTLIAAFNKDYGPFHTSLKNADAILDPFFDLFFGF